MSATEDMALGESMLFDPTAPLIASGNLRRRGVISRVVDLIAIAAAAVAIAMLTWVVWTVIKRGAPALSFAFFTTNPTGLGSGGILNMILGTLEIVFIAAAIAVPVGVLIALYLTEFAGPRSRIARVLSVALEMMQGLPTIVVGLFVFGLLVLPLHKETGFAGSVALAIVMLPLIARASQEMLLLVPSTLRDAADALGVTRWRGVIGIILPAARTGIVTGSILAIARAAGETAPLLLCDALFNIQTTQLNPAQGVPNIPMYIYQISDLAIPDAFERAWGAAFALMAFILLANVGARFLLARSRKKSGL